MHMHVQGHARNQILPGGSQPDLSEPVRHVSLRSRGDMISPLQGQRGSVALPMHSTGPGTMVRIKGPASPCASSAGLWRLATLGWWIHHIVTSLGCAGEGLQRTISESGSDNGAISLEPRGDRPDVKLSCMTPGRQGKRYRAMAASGTLVCTLQS
ncbi:hypothetical protein BO94DRAFT_111107 [Aspergillus sclerotioniger CBS 115572]|uniref:Uncharacterized protein n=1 Tax=Aspergillus sclerotioniger CBS 115572 TaxID=1450535 RepID=A0A317WFK4_9EURO|nr:hypothetical protein BO94DRAFT_111107 [Aspergillus sclerotioniger CBS 115572]PWY84725.1 hypothetical protein BO94DRAFT_111107 [Aspergillus sclerotioniger CBS 115572]